MLANVKKDRASRSRRSRKNRKNKRHQVAQGNVHMGAVTKSRGQMEVEGVLKNMGFTVLSEFEIENRSFDILVHELNLIIEFNGTRWHYDERFYEADHYDICKNRFVHQKWEADKQKIEVATVAGYGVAVIWQHDWETTEQKHKLVKRVLRQRQNTLFVA